MLVAAALVPDTVLLVPGASGRRDVAGSLRAAALAAVTAAVARADRVVVVAPGERTGGRATGPDVAALRASPDGALAPVGRVRASLASSGVPEHLVPAVVRDLTDPGAGTAVPRDEVGGATAVALHLLAAAGWAGPTGCLELERPSAARAAAAVDDDGREADEAGAAGPDEHAERLRAAGERVAGTGRVALVVVGSASGRHGPDAPLADDPDAPAHDARLVADLRTADPAARARLRTLDAPTAAALAVTGWGPWQVLLGAVGDATGAPADVRADVRGEVLLGAQHVVGTWTVAA